MPRLNTDSLGGRICNLEEAAFKEFAVTYRRLFLVHFRRKRIPPMEAEDLVDECLCDIPLKAVRHWAAERGSFDAWVLALMRNAASDWWRRRQKLETVSLTEGIEPVAPQRADPEPEQREFLQLNLFLEQLSPEDRSLLELKYFSGESTYSEVARAMPLRNGKPPTPTAIRVRHLRIIRRLRTMFRSAADQKS
jgi:RNA polymerase sigma factor (sigma-70 family)